MVSKLPLNFNRWERGKESGPQSPRRFSLLLNIIISALSSLLLLWELATKAAHSEERPESGVIAAKNVTSETRCRAAGQGAQGARRPWGKGQTHRHREVGKGKGEGERSRRLVQLCFSKQSKRLIPGAGNNSAPIPSSTSRSGKSGDIKMLLLKWAARLPPGTANTGSGLRQQIARGGKMTPGVRHTGAKPELVAVAMP